MLHFKRDGFLDGAGRSCDALSAHMFSVALEEGVTISDTVDLGKATMLRLTQDVSAVEGTSPTLDTTLLTSPDGKAWRSLGTFTQKSGVGTAMLAAAAEAGTSPPNVTLSGTPDRVIDFKMWCTTLGARGVFVVKYSLDGGVTIAQSGVTPPDTAAETIVYDADGVDTGLRLTFQDAAASVDNVWTASCLGREHKCFGPCDRYVRAVNTVGGSATPIVTASINGKAF